MANRIGTLSCISLIRHEYYKRVLSHILGLRKNIIIVGGGTGDSTLDYLHHANLLWFTDIQKENVDKACKRISDARMAFMSCSAYDIPLADDSVDVIVSTLNGSYFNLQALKEFHRILKKDGLIVLSETTNIYIEYLASIGRYDGTNILSSDMQEKILHQFTYSEEELTELLNGFSLNIVIYDVLSPINIAPDIVSQNIINFSNYLNVPYQEAPLLYYAVVRKC